MRQCRFFPDEECWKLQFCVISNNLKANFWAENSFYIKNAGHLLFQMVPNCSRHKKFQHLNFQSFMINFVNYFKRFTIFSGTIFLVFNKIEVGKKSFSSKFRASSAFLGRETFSFIITFDCQHLFLMCAASCYGRARRQPNARTCQIWHYQSWEIMISLRFFASAIHEASKRVH